MISPLTRLFGLCVLTALPAIGHGQDQLSGQVLDDDGITLPFANVLLVQASDSSLVMGEISDDHGFYRFEAVPPGTFRLMASMVGFESIYSEVMTISGPGQIELPPIILRSGVELQEVQIIGRKPLYEQKIDRLVVNVENSILSAGNTALDILQRSPGVVVNPQNQSISLVGKEGVVIMINGKVSYQPIAGILQMLDGMSADNIASIELITTPPAHLDAEGNAGFINIVLKSRSDLGLNGSYSLTFGVGNGTVTNDNLNFNYRNGLLNLYGSYGFVRGHQQDIWLSERKIFGDTLLYSTTFADRDPTQRNHDIRLGADLSVTEQTIVGVLFTAYDNKWSMDAVNHNLSWQDDQLLSRINLANTERNQWRHLGGNVNLRHNFSEHQYLSADFDYLYYQDENPNTYKTRFYDAGDVLIDIENSRSDKTTPINILVGKIDFHTRLGNTASLDIGGKVGDSHIENTVSVETLSGSSWTPVPEYTNAGELNERVYAAYLSGDYQLSEKTSIRAGLRYEFTDSELDTEEEGRVVDRAFGEFFPSVFMNHAFNDDVSLNLSYSRRITRPTFNDMAPFVIFLDPNTFFTGNTALQPAIGQTIKLDFKYRTLYTSLQYSVEDSTIARWQQRIDVSENKLIYEPFNLRNSRYVSLTIGLPVHPTPWWEIRLNMTGGYRYVAGYNNQELEIFENFALNFNLTNTLTFGNDWTAEVNLNYYGSDYYGLGKIDATYLLTAGIQKDFGEKWGKLQFNVSDIMDSLEWNMRRTSANSESYTVYNSSNRTFSLTYSRNFGNKRLSEARKRATGAEEERHRVN